MLSEEPILAMVREGEYDEEGGDDKIKDQCLKKPTSTQFRSAIETLLDLNFFIESDKLQRFTVEISKLIEKNFHKL